MASSLLTLGLEATAGTFADCALRKHTSQLLHIKRVSHCTPKKTPLTYTGDGRFIHLEERFRFASVQWLVMADQEAANVKVYYRPTLIGIGMNAVWLYGLGIQPNIIHDYAYACAVNSAVHVMSALW